MKCRKQLAQCREWDQSRRGSLINIQQWNFIPYLFKEIVCSMIQVAVWKTDGLSIVVKKTMIERPAVAGDADTPGVVRNSLNHPLSDFRKNARQIPVNMTIPVQRDIPESMDFIYAEGAIRSQPAHTDAAICRTQIDRDITPGQVLQVCRHRISLSLPGCVRSDAPHSGWRPESEEDSLRP